MIMLGDKCKKAEHWLAAFEVGELDTAESVRLHEHLESCPACREKSLGTSALVSLLRQAPAELPPERMQAIWNQMQKGSRTTRPQGRPEKRILRPLAVGAISVAMAVVVGLLVWKLSVRPDQPAPAVEGTTEAPEVAVEQPPATPSVRWRLVASNGVKLGSGTVSAGASIAQHQPVHVGEGGRALLVTSQEVVLADARTEFVLEDTRRIRLLHGTLSVLTLDDPTGDSRELAIVHEAWRIRPVGTAYSVRAVRSRGARVLVAAGEVMCERDELRLVVAAGTLRVLGGEARRLTERERGELERVLARVRRLAHSSEHPAAGKIRIEGQEGGDIRVDGLSLGTGRVTVWAEPGEHRLVLAGAGKRRIAEKTVRLKARGSQEVRLEGNVPAGPKRSGRLRPTRRRGWRPRPATGSELAADLQKIRELLAEGETVVARDRARRLLGRTLRPADKAELRTLIAESLVKEGEYKRAVARYLDVFRLHANTDYGAHALYMAASLELHQLKGLVDARRHLQRYLDTYSTGRQRQDAYYSLHTTLLRMGDDGQARQVARNYLEEFPDGEYTDFMQPPKKTPHPDDNSP
jgi:hypothetical protein